MVGTGQLTMNIHSTQRWYVADEIATRASVVSCSGGGLCLEGSAEKGTTLTFQRYLILDAKKTIDRLS